MKNFIKSIIAVATLLLCSTNTWAGSFVVPIIQVDGQANEAGGTVTIDKPEATAGETVTITAKPNDGYYLDPANVTVIKTIDGAFAQTRDATLSTPLTVTHASGDDITGEATFTFVMPDTGKDGVLYGAEVTVNFQTRTDISTATVTADGTFAYTGEPIVPETITVKLGSSTLTETTDYSLLIENNTNPGKATIIATGVGKYTGSATGEFTIDKAEATLKYSKETAEVTLQAEFEAPTLTVTPEGLEGITYSSSNTNAATIAEDGKVTIVGAGETTITAAFAGDEHYKEAEASYVLTVNKITTELKYSKETAEATMGAEFEAPTLTVSPEGLQGITYTSSNTSAATIAEDGKVTIVGVGETTIKASYAGSDTYEAAEASYVLTVNNATMTVSATGFEGTFDKEAHSITVTVTSPEGAVVKYGTTEGTYDLTENPTYTDAGTYTVYYQVTKDGYETTTGSATVKISKATPTVTAPTAKENLTYTGEAQELISAGSTTGGELQYSLDNETYSTSIPKGTEAKEYTVYYKVVGGTNYEDVTAASIKVTISEAAPEKMTVSATGFDGAYDGKAHNISVTVTTPAEGAVVKYGTTEGTYDLTENLTYTEAGTYTVYYQVTKDGYETTTGSATVKISKATPTVTAPTAKENLTYTGEAQELISAGSTTGGELQYSLDNETYSTSIPKGTEAKEYTVYYKVVGNTNYEDVAAASIKVTISEAAPEKMTVSATGFEGAYDKEAHSITVTVTSPEGAVVKYGTTEGTYDLTENPTYTEAGTYTVYYQVTKDGYETTTGSATVKINKAKPTVTAPTAKENLTYTGEAQELISAGSTTGGELQYSLDNATYSKNIPTGTEVNEYTVYYKVIGGTNYEDVAAASIKVTISRAAGEGYLLWVNDTQVTSDNAEDVLGHKTDSSKPYYIYNKDKKQLYMDNDQTRTTVIESRMPELTVYIKDANKIKRIFFNNTGDTSNKGNLTFTTNGNFPGKLIIANPTKGQSAIKGFSNISYNWDLTAIEPDGSYYDTTTLEMKYKNEMEATVIADTITIGEAIVPITEKKAITFEESQLVEKDEDGKVKKDESGNPIKANLSNYSYAPSSTTGEPEKNVIHISLNSANIGNDAGGFDIENGVGGIYIEDTMTDEKAGQVAQDVNDNKIVPGGTLYAERYDGFTFKLIAGSGTIEIDEIVENDHEFHLIIGTNKPITLNENNSIIRPYDGKSVRVQAEIAFNVGAPTYCYLYMVKKTAGTRGTRLGKRDKAHGKLVSVQVRSTTVIPTEPPSEATGGVIPKSDDPEPETDPTPPTGIREVKSDKMAVKSGWYTIDGQKIAEPTQRGLYIKDGRKVVIK